MLHPNQFQVNEAWIAFQLNEAPLRTETEGGFNCLALMDAASCFILTNAFIPASAAGPSKLESRRMLKKGSEHKHELPKTLFLPTGQPADHLALEAERQKITVVRVEESYLLLFIGEAREGFKEHFGSERAQ